MINLRKCKHSVLEKQSNRVKYENVEKIWIFLKKGLPFLYKCGRINSVVIPGVAQLVARLTGGQEAVSSSLATRTKKGSSL